MRIILKEEVINLGLPGDVVDVADGYARNFLIPRGMAIHATRGAMKEAEAITRARKAREAQTVGQAEQYRTVLEERALKIPARVDEFGHLYGSVNVNDVHRVLKERGHEVDRRRIELRGSIKQLGTYEIPVHIHPQVTATVTVEVVDVEGKVLAGGRVEPEVDEAAAAAAAADAAEDSVTDVDVLTEQAIEAAREYEEQHVEEAAADDAAADDEAALDEETTDASA